MEDCDIIELYWQRDQGAIQATADKYGGYLWNITWNILRCHGDAEECVNDTYLRTWNAIPPARPSAFRAWLGRIARNLSLDRWKQLRTQKRGGDSMEVLLGELDDCVPAPHGTEKAMEERETAALRREAVNLELRVNEFHNLDRIAARAQEMGMAQPDETQIRAVRVEETDEDTSTQAAGESGGEKALNDDIPGGEG